MSLSRTRHHALLISRLTVMGIVVMSYGSAFAGGKDAIVTDRPDFVESSDVVGQGRFQIETSVAMERNNVNGIKDRTFSTPTLFRIGVSKDIELRFETDGRMSNRYEDSVTGITTTTTGYADASVGLKWHMVDEAGAMPSMGLLAHVDLDTGSSQFRGNGTRPSLRITAEWDLPHELSLGVMPGLTFNKDANGHRFTSGIFAVVLGKSWNDNFRTFVEVASPQIARSSDGGSLVTFDVGAAYLLSNTLQIDTALSKGLNKNTPDLSWTIGISSKF